MSSPQDPTSSPQPDWVEIPEKTVRELRDRSTRSPWPMRQQFDPLQFSGYPVHFHEGKWYIEVQHQGWVDPEHLLRIEEVLEVGAVRRDPTQRLTAIWDGEHWLKVPDETMSAAHMYVEELLQRDLVTPQSIEKLKAHLEEHEAEKERLRLRQLLAESQDDDDG